MKFLVLYILIGKFFIVRYLNQSDCLTHWPPFLVAFVMLENDWRLWYCYN